MLDKDRLERCQGLLDPGGTCPEVWSRADSAHNALTTANRKWLASGNYWGERSVKRERDLERALTSDLNVNFVCLSVCLSGP